MSRFVTAHVGVPEAVAFAAPVGARGLWRGAGHGDGVPQLRADAEMLQTERRHGGGGRAREHAALRIEAAMKPPPPRQRCLERRRARDGGELQPAAVVPELAAIAQPQRERPRGAGRHAGGVAGDEEGTVVARRRRTRGVGAEVGAFDDEQAVEGVADHLAGAEPGGQSGAQR